MSRPAVRPRRSARPTALITVTLLVALTVSTLVALHLAYPAGRAAADPPPSPSAATPTFPAPTGTASTGRARQLLDQVPVRGRGPLTGYTRHAYGTGWATVAGCDMRNRTLARDLVDLTYRPGPHRCVVDTGTLHDPYTGRTVAFVRGNTTSTLVQIDHRFPLALSWQQGAQQWTAAKREQFANDPMNLQAVSGSVNESKGDSGLGSWLPPNKAGRCSYVSAFVTVAARWGLSMNPGDHSAAAAVLDHCP